jgi:Zn-dependent protease with chaperone function
MWVTNSIIQGLEQAGYRVERVETVETALTPVAIDIAVLRVFTEHVAGFITVTGKGDIAAQIEVYRDGSRILRRMYAGRYEDTNFFYASASADAYQVLLDAAMKDFLRKTLTDLVSALDRAFEFAPDDKLVTSVEYRAAQLPISSKPTLTSKARVPSRPALTDVAASLASVRVALTRSGQGFNWVGATQEYTQAQQMYSLIHRKWPVVTDRDMQRYLNGVMDRLTAVTPRPPFPWTIRVVDASTLNAMNLGGGIILINSGLFKHLDSEAQLAYVISHEMGHQIKHHLAAIQTKQQFAQLLVGAAVLATAGMGHPEAARAINSIGSLAAGATLASFSRTQEIEADEVGLHILIAAEYDPREAEKVMEKFVELRALLGASTPLFSTHPDPAVRLTNVRRLLGGLNSQVSVPRVVTTHEFAEFKDLYRY